MKQNRMYAEFVHQWPLISGQEEYANGASYWHYVLRSKLRLSNYIRLNPSIQHHVGDMRIVPLHRTFRTVLIHDDLSYMLAEDDLRATFATAISYLEPGGGLTTVWPDWYHETFKRTSVSVHGPKHNNNVKLTFIECSYDPDPNDIHNGNNLHLFHQGAWRSPHPPGSSRHWPVPSGYMAPLDG